ncbi:hypothetical protein ABPG75_009146 [Micractinium tetrahymenae]
MAEGSAASAGAEPIRGAEPAGPQPPSQQQHVNGAVLLPMAAAQAFRVITHPRNEQIFRHLEHCAHHEVLADDGSGRVLVESEHVATWRLLALHGHLRTRLLVEQDHRALVSRFKLIHGRFSPLRTFQGRWEVHPQPPERCAQAHGSNAGSPGSLGGQCCELTLEQELQPAVWLPPPLGGLLRQLACRQLRGVFQDLQAEAARINAGRPSLWDSEPQPP